VGGSNTTIKSSEHLQMIRFWPPHAPEEVCGGAKFLAPPYYSQHAVFAGKDATFKLFA